MVKLVDLYIGRAALLGTIAVWFVLTLLFLVIDLLDELRNVQDDYSTVDALWVLVLTIPRLAYKIFPVSALLGALVGVGGLAAANELVVFRTSGISRIRLALAAIAGTMSITVFVMVIGEWVAPAAEQQARAFKLSEMVGQAIIGGPSGMWIREGADYVNIQRPVLTADRGQQSVDFKDVVIYNFSDEADLQTITRAQTATHNGTNWTLEGVESVRFSAEGATETAIDRMDWLTELKPELLDSAVSRPNLLSIRSLWDYLGYLGENGLDDSVYLSAFWKKVLFPLTVFALVLAGMPFVFGSARSQNVGVRLFFGMTLGGVFMIVSRALEKFGNIYEIAPVLTIMAPVAALIVAAILVLRRSTY
ncbi:MAG: LPS export ABC transporter permease LptG [Xanthomonadales bacterium]|nr:LPS export ABC transporter permease LptG [Gammaproteobacteria bacterium]MBT8052641.1 LPS export ABC transporter permease LptG [Gammaproteobacteria bacterium]NND56600.1 LPS export ABC transporter permease LptG [Xanthomonadales bacterium]NNK52458.1 LPS export ABC transporter permease LptG [Xanthomonadales bacterium]